MRASIDGLPFLDDVLYARCIGERMRGLLGKDNIEGGLAHPFCIKRAGAFADPFGVAVITRKIEYPLGFGRKGVARDVLLRNGNRGSTFTLDVNVFFDDHIDQGQCQNKNHSAHHEACKLMSPDVAFPFFNNFR